MPGDYYGDLANAFVYPSELDHHGSAAEGLAASVMETYMASLLYGHAPWLGSVKSGFNVPTTGSGLTFNIPVGEAILLGHRIYGTGNVSVEFTGGGTWNWVFLVLEYDSSLRVIRPIITVNTTGTKPANSMLLGRVYVSATPAITDYEDCRWAGRASWGSLSAAGAYVNRGSNDWTPSGTYTLTFASATFPCSMCYVVPSSGSYIPRVQRTSDTVFTVTFLDHAGSAATSAFTFFMLT